MTYTHNLQCISICTVGELQPDPVNGATSGIMTRQSRQHDADCLQSLLIYAVLYVYGVRAGDTNSTLGLHGPIEKRMRAPHVYGNHENSIHFRFAAATVENSRNRLSLDSYNSLRISVSAGLRLHTITLSEVGPVVCFRRFATMIVLSPNQRCRFRSVPSTWDARFFDEFRLRLFHLWLVDFQGFPPWRQQTGSGLPKPGTPYVFNGRSTLRHSL